ncbi:hypothetical protein [Proteiniclasticum sp.]|uniref:hypothetical protein n=1 Tax=Proteiniclasticum sp. TaxID=2053595 RepID=UPI00289D8B7E|nr:hypothetical protein [Proteiniclasticum sp.]
MNNELIQYIIALSNLYGMVHKRKVLEIYNQQNTDKITIKDIELLQENIPGEVDDAWIEVHKGYFVSSVILEHHEFLYYLREKENKPYYVPKKVKLLNYADGFYWEKNQEYYRVVSHLKKYFSKDSEKAVDIAGDVQLLCQFDYKLNQILDRMEQMGVVFKNDVDIQKTLNLVVQLKNNTRIWENNGYSPNELREILDLKMKEPVPALSVAYPGKSSISCKLE